jgi:hypothetical protein
VVGSRSPLHSSWLPRRPSRPEKRGAWRIVKFVRQYAATSSTRFPQRQPHGLPRRTGRHPYADDAGGWSVAASRLRTSAQVKLQPTRRCPLQLMPIASPSRAASGSTRSHQVSRGMELTRSPRPHVFAALEARAEVDQNGRLRVPFSERWVGLPSSPWTSQTTRLRRTSLKNAAACEPL